jgi:hypothetical protein
MFLGQTEKVEKDLVRYEKEPAGKAETRSILEKPPGASERIDGPPHGFGLEGGREK